MIDLQDVEIRNRFYGYMRKILFRGALRFRNTKKYQIISSEIPLEDALIYALADDNSLGWSRCILSSHSSLLSVYEELNEQEINVIYLKYSYRLTDLEISKILNVSRSYVNKIHNSALNKFKECILE